MWLNHVKLCLLVWLIVRDLFACNYRLRIFCCVPYRVISDVSNLIPNIQNPNWPLKPQFSPVMHCQKIWSNQIWGNVVLASLTSCIHADIFKKSISLLTCTFEKSNLNWVEETCNWHLSPLMYSQISCTNGL